MKDIILFGMPWAGKGTQAELLLEKKGHEYNHLSTGDIFRALFSSPNPIEKHMKSVMSAGNLVDDRISMAVFDMFLYVSLNEQKSMMLDGYPRTIPQLNALLTTLHAHNREMIGLYFVLPEDVAIERMKSRWRDGETDEVIKKRLQTYYDETQPIIDAFVAQQKMITIDASGTPEQIHQRVLEVLA